MVITTSAVRRAKTFFDAVINDYGIREGNQVRIPMRQCELAQRRRVSASTIGAHLRALGDSVVARHPHILITTAVVGGNYPPLHDPQVDVDQDVLAAFAAVVEAQARLIELLAESATIPRGTATIPRGSATDPRGTATDLAKKHQVRREEEPSSSSSPPSPSPEIRDDSATNRDDPRGTATPSDGVADLDVVLGPLHQLAHRRSLLPMNDRHGVVSALEPYTRTEIANAVDRIVALCDRPHSSVRSPFGLLVRWARSGDCEHFADLVAGPEPDERVEAEQVVDPPFDEAVIAEIARMEADPEAFADELRRLDEHIARDQPRLHAHGLRPAMRRAMRTQVLAELRGASASTPQASPDELPVGSPQGNLGASARMPQAHRGVTYGTPMASPQVTFLPVDGGRR